MGDLKRRLLVAVSVFAVSGGLAVGSAERTYGQETISGHPEQLDTEAPVAEQVPPDRPETAPKMPRCLGRTATILGTTKADDIRGTRGADVIVGLKGNDRIYGRGGHDVICGNEGDDTVTGGTGRDHLQGGKGKDSIHGLAGDDQLDGGGSMDLLSGSSGNDVLRGASGHDELSGGSGSDTAYSGPGTDWCRESERQVGCESAYRRSLVRVPGTTKKTGTGTLYTYQILIEKGIALDREKTAEEIDDILADKRGWTRSGRIAVKRVSSGANTNIIIATPEKTDALCYPLQTRGRVSCRQGINAVINLNRWRYAVPHWAKGESGIASYRAMVTTHEFGHRTGQGHRSCPFRGAKAPVMQQQTKFLLGCKANPWPLAYEF